MLLGCSIWSHDISFRVDLVKSGYTFHIFIIIRVKDSCLLILSL